MDDLVYWIWLSLSCTIDTGTFSKLIAHFKDARSVYDANDQEISACIGPKISDRANLINKDLSRAEEIYDFCIKHRVGLLKYSDERYPNALRKISTPPVLLYYRGQLPDFNSRLCVSIVGTRELSEYGRKNAFNFGYDLAAAGAIVVSGMALGIDGVALAGALAAERPTVAVLGSGIDVCYPSQHLTLAREIVKSGCILTEYPPKTRPVKYNFPKRNRIISGLSAATLVVEGRERSGSLITARYAKEQKRDVFAIPGNIGSDHSEVTNLLIKNGAKPATHAEDILSVYAKDYPSCINLFVLTDRLPVDMMYVLRTLEVVANCPSDDIYNQPWIIKRITRPAKEPDEIRSISREDTVDDAGEYENKTAVKRESPSSGSTGAHSANTAGAISGAVSSYGATSAKDEVSTVSNAIAKDVGSTKILAARSDRFSSTDNSSGKKRLDRGGASSKSQYSLPEKSYGEQVLERFTAKILAKEEAREAELAAERLAAKKAREERKQKLGVKYDIDNIPGYKRITITESGAPAHYESGRAATANINDFDYDAETLQIYKNIPPGGAVELEELTTENMPLRVVMKHLSRLEAGKFIVVLPGGKVMRKY